MVGREVLPRIPKDYVAFRAIIDHVCMNVIVSCALQFRFKHT